ncbi:MAG TPA: hypothetical protein VL978_04780 [Puia sp.]|nr:hypothetical protein [Puia sp.]
MTREAIIQKTIEVLSALPDDKIEEVSDFADYVLKKYDDRSLQKEMHALIEQSGTFNFVREDEEIYSVTDLKERYK